MGDPNDLVLSCTEQRSLLLGQFLLYKVWLAQLVLPLGAQLEQQRHFSQEQPWEELQALNSLVVGFLDFARGTARTSKVILGKNLLEEVRVSITASSTSSELEALDLPGGDFGGAFGPGILGAFEEEDDALSTRTKPLGSVS